MYMYVQYIDMYICTYMYMSQSNQSQLNHVCTWLWKCCITIHLIKLLFTALVACRWVLVDTLILPSLKEASVICRLLGAGDAVSVTTEVFM